MSKSRLQLVNIKHLKPEPPPISFFKKFRESVYQYFNDPQDDLQSNEENQLTRIDCSIDNPELKAITGIITENLFHGIKILEVGCGNGSLYQHLYKLSVQFTGLDKSSKAINTAKDTFRNTQNTGKPVFHVKDFTEYSAISNFDIIVLNNILDSYRVSETDLVLGKAASILRNSSSIVIISMPQSVKSMLVWKKINRYPVPYVNISIKNYFSGRTTKIKAYKGFE